MDKSTIRVTLNHKHTSAQKPPEQVSEQLEPPIQPEVSSEPNQSPEIPSNLYFSAFSGQRNRRFSKKRTERRNAPTARTEAPSKQSPRWLIPTLYALVTGLVLGFGLLFLFTQSISVIPNSTTAPLGTQSPSAPTVTPAPNKQAGGGSTITTPGVVVQALQVGVFQDADSAQKGRDNLQQKGVTSLMTGDNPIRLISAVAVDTDQLQPYIQTLKDKKVDYYIREWSIPQKQVTAVGVNQSDAAKLQSWLQNVSTTAIDGLKLSLGTPDTTSFGNWKKKVSQLQQDFQSLKSASPVIAKSPALNKVADTLGQLTTQINQKSDSTTIQMSWITLFQSIGYFSISLETN